MSNENQLKLYVVGESSGDPGEWGEFGSRFLVLARNPAEARQLTDWGDSAACALVERKSARVLMAHQAAGSF